MKQHHLLKYKMYSDTCSEVKIIKQIQDVGDTHLYSAKSMFKEINRLLKKHKVPFNYHKDFNQYVFKLFDEVYGIRENSEFCYAHKVYASPTYTYSRKCIEFIFNEIKKDPKNIIQNLKKSIEKKKN